MGWEEAGSGWGARAPEWAYLFEPYALPAIEAAGYERFCEILREKISPFHDPHVGTRITSEFGWITAESPTT